MAKRIFDENEIMTALCLWEAVLELRSVSEVARDKGDEVSNRIHLKLDDLFDQYGSFAMRQAAIDLVTDAEAAWEAAKALQGDDLCFDFEFCPSFIAGTLESGVFEETIKRQYAPRASKAA